MKIQARSKVIMIGDSITDCGRTRALGENWYEPEGNGYVSYVNGLVQARYPCKNIQIVNRGISGDTVRDLKARWQVDVMDLVPDWVSIYIGVNDALRYFDKPVGLDYLVSTDIFEQTLDALIRATRPVVDGLVLITPCWIEPAAANPKHAMVEKYAQIVSHLAEQHQTILIDAQAVFDRALQFFDHSTLAWDHVHPTHTGHMLLARAFLQAVDFEWD